LTNFKAHHEGCQRFCIPQGHASNGQFHTSFQLKPKYTKYFQQSWSPRNLYNLWRRSCAAEADAIDFTRSPLTLFQQRWISKALVRGYHGDFINEKIFKRWYLPDTLPDVRPRKHAFSSNGDLDAFAGRTEQLERAKKRAFDEERKGLAPVGSLMLAEVERRIDVFVFRCCFAHSVYEARRLVIHGSVLLNGKKVR
jgi:hypothetical protein